MAELKYGDKIIRMEGVIVEVHDGSVAMDLKRSSGLSEGADADVHQ